MIDANLVLTHLIAIWLYRKIASIMPISIIIRHLIVTYLRYVSHVELRIIKFRMDGLNING